MPRFVFDGPHIAIADRNVRMKSVFRELKRPDIVSVQIGKKKHELRNYLVAIHNEDTGRLRLELLVAHGESTSDWMLDVDPEVKRRRVVFYKTTRSMACHMKAPGGKRYKTVKIMFTGEGFERARLLLEPLMN